MFEHLDDGARVAMANAYFQAKELRHRQISPDHILLGILGGKDTSALRALRDLGVEPPALQQAIEQRMERGHGPSPGALERMRDRLRQNPAATKIIEHAIDEARDLGDRFVGTEHLLLGIIRSPANLAGEALAAAGVTYADARRVIDAMTDRETKSHTPAFRFPHLSQPVRVACAAGLQRAQALGHHEIAPEHVLLGLLGGEKTNIMQILRGLDVDRAQLQKDIEHRLAAGLGPPADRTRPFDRIVAPAPGASDPAHLPQSRAMKRLIEHALDEARNLEHEIAGTEHMLLGILRNSDAPSTRILAARHGVKHATARAELEAAIERGEYVAEAE